MFLLYQETGIISYLSFDPLSRFAFLIQQHHFAAPSVLPFLLALIIPLDKFSGFFIAPLLDQKYIDKEINAVNSESVKNLLDDNWISQEIIRTLVDKQHPFNHYTCGTSESLTRPDIHNKLQEFHDKYYLGQYMSLVVFINNDINMNNLCSQILDTFGKINNNSDKINTRYGRLLKEKK